MNDDEDPHDKKAAIQKKIREKDNNLRQNSSQQQNLPFKILTPNQAN